MIDRIHHVGVVVRSADAALGFFRDTMELEVTADQVMTEQGVRGVLLALGENEIELLEPVVPDTGVSRFLESRGETLHHICLNTDNVAAELARLKAADVQLIDEEPREGLAGQIGFIHHLAATVGNLDAASKTWETVAGLRVANIIRPESGTMEIAQLPCGQCVIELLVPTSDDSPMAKRIAEQGERASSMVAIEVEDIESEVARYRAAGIELDDATPGVLPNSVRTSISAEQAFGLSIQLIAYSG